jgi:hypothetical protein
MTGVGLLVVVVVVVVVGLQVARRRGRSVD